MLGAGQIRTGNRRATQSPSARLASLGQQSCRPPLHYGWKDVDGYYTGASIMRTRRSSDTFGKQTKGHAGAPMMGVRRSCDACGRKKKKCGGGKPCMRCVGCGSRCTYSKRKLHVPHTQHQQQYRDDGPGSDGVAARAFPWTSDHLSGITKLSLKRCRWSPSPATGLVGMQENAFLADFFTSVGFIPFTTQSHVREAMVKLLVSSDTRQRVGDAHQRADTWNDCVILKEPSSLGGSNQQMDLSACTFWCVVALGALVRGSPVESVTNYSKMAITGLSSYTGPVNAEVAKAWTMLAYVYLLTSNMEMFCEYMTLAESFLNAYIEEGSSDLLPVGFAEIIHHGMSVTRISQEVTNSERRPFCAHKEDIFQLNGVATEPELYRYIWRSYKSLGNEAYEASLTKFATTDGACLTGAESDHEHSGVPTCHSTTLVEFMTSSLVETFSDYERLFEDVMNRPSFCTGIGVIFICGALVYKKAAEGKLNDALEYISHCAEVFDRFPGLCRFVMISHTLHVMMAALDVIDDPRAPGLYQTLRTAHNSTLGPGASSLPPMEEWEGISLVCDGFFCRVVGGFLESRKRDSPESTGGHVPHNDVCGEGDGEGHVGLRNTGDDWNEVSSGDAEFDGSISSPGHNNDVESNMSSIRMAKPWFSTVTGPSLAPALPITPAIPLQQATCQGGESQVWLNTNLGSREGESHVTGEDMDNIARALGSKRRFSPVSTGSDGKTIGGRDEGCLGAEDWLEAVDALNDASGP